MHAVSIDATACHDMQLAKIVPQEDLLLHVGITTCKGILYASVAASWNTCAQYIGTHVIHSVTAVVTANLMYQELAPSYAAAYPLQKAL